MAFFKQFPKVQYDFERNGIVQNVVNIYRSVRPLQNFIDDSTAYTFYEIKNCERPDIVSQRLYDKQRHTYLHLALTDYLNTQWSL